MERAIVVTASSLTLKQFKWDTEAELKPYELSPPTYKTFQATPGILRGFFGECGSTLVWYDTTREEIDILVGSMEDLPAAGLKITEAVSSLLTGLTAEFL